MAKAPDDPSFLDRLRGVLASPYSQDLGLSLLANSGYSTTPRTFGQVAGQSALMAQQMEAQRSSEDIKKRYMEAQIQALQQKSRSPFGEVQPDKFTPASLAKFMQTGNYGDLVPEGGGVKVGNYNPGEYTPESWASFVANEYKDPSVLRRYVAPANPVVQLVNGVPTVVQPSKPGAAGPATPTLNPLSTIQTEADAAAAKAAAEAAAKAQGTAAGNAAGGKITRGSNADTVIGMLDIADPLIDASTGSVAGAAADKLAGVFGIAPKGAQAAAQLQVIQAGLMLNMPRMEGPQSDRDVQLYRQSAGQIGDPNVPNTIKKAAVQTIRQLQEKYKDAASQVPQVFPNGSPEAQRGDIEAEMRRRGLLK